MRGYTPNVEWLHSVPPVATTGLTQLVPMVSYDVAYVGVDSHTTWVLTHIQRLDPGSSRGLAEAGLRPKF
jgi:hypothetical protein